MPEQTVTGARAVPGQRSPGQRAGPRQSRAAPPAASSSPHGGQLLLALALPGSPSAAAFPPPLPRDEDTRPWLPLLWQRLGSDCRPPRKHTAPGALHSPAPRQLPRPRADQLPLAQQRRDTGAAGRSAPRKVRAGGAAGLPPGWGNAASPLGPGAGGGGGCRADIHNRAPTLAPQATPSGRSTGRGGADPHPPQPAGRRSGAAPVRGGGGGAGGPGRSRARRHAGRLPQTSRPGEERILPRPLLAPRPPQTAGRPRPGPRVAVRGWAPHLYFLADAGRHGAGRSPRVPLRALLRISAAGPHHGAPRRPPRPRPARSWARRPLPSPAASILKNRAVTPPAPPPDRGCV